MNGAHQDERPEVVATIGVFDGVHVGHQRLMSRVLERARVLGARSACITFSPHPQEVLRPDRQVPHLASLADRLRLIRGLGMDEVMVVEFTSELSQLSPEEFIGLVERRFRLRELWVGANFALGKNRAGNPERLAAIGTERDFGVHTFPQMESDGQVVSSSRIRDLLLEGKVEGASRLLGRFYRLPGRVVEGDRRGRSLGFATANLAPGDRMLVPGDGIYATWCWLEGEQEPRPSAASIGVRPTFGGGRRQIEAHIFDFDGNLYGQELAIEFVGWLRGEERFDSPEELVAQVIEDVKNARVVLATRGRIAIAS